MLINKQTKTEVKNMGKCVNCGKTIKSRYTRCYRCHQKWKRGEYRDEDDIKATDESYENTVLNDNYYGRGRW